LPGLLLYFSGPALAASLVSAPPAAWVVNWLRRGMYFDELYKAIVVVPVLWLAETCAMLDQRVVDGLVRLVAMIIGAGSIAAAVVDNYVVDVAVRQVGASFGDMGAWARRSQSGRVRWYLTALMTALALAAAVLVLRQVG
jgi:NADH:ubiquinone oxidoreductase subunit 5 (subunit L)/multisubunit Na+/H+ antiporter MnhA subunit